MRSVEEWVAEISSQLTMNRRGQWDTILSSAVQQIRNEQKKQFIELLDNAAHLAEMQGHEEAVEHIEGIAMTVAEEQE